MSDAIDVPSALRASLVRSVDPVLLALSLVGAGGGMLVTLAIHAAGLTPSLSPGHGISNYGITLLTSACTLVVSSLAHAAMVLRVASREQRTPLSFGAALAAGFSRLHLVYGAQVVVSFATGVGIALCFLPGLYVALLLAVATAVVAIERVGPIEAVSRCQALVSGRLGAIALVVLPIWLVIAIVLVACVAVAGALAPSPGGLMPLLREMGALDQPVMIGAMLVSRTVYGAIWAATITVLYLRLREREMPTQGERIAEVFE